MNQNTAREILIEAGVDAAELAQVEGDHGLDLHGLGGELDWWKNLGIAPSDLLQGAFFWEATPQGADYWCGVQLILLEKEQLEGNV